MRDWQILDDSPVTYADFEDSDHMIRVFRNEDTHPRREGIDYEKSSRQSKLHHHFFRSDLVLEWKQEGPQTFVRVTDKEGKNEIVFAVALTGGELEYLNRRRQKFFTREKLAGYVNEAADLLRSQGWSLKSPGSTPQP